MAHLTHTTTGFSLIETLVAISILTVAVVGPMTLASSGISSSLLARDQVTAIHLAQEGIEYIRNRRDDNFLSGDNWETGLGACISGDGSQECIVDVRQDTIEACTAGCEPLRFHEASGFYTYDVGEESQYTRTISVERISTVQLLVESTVAWSGTTGQRSFTVQEYLFDWE